MRWGDLLRTPISGTSPFTGVGFLSRTSSMAGCRAQPDASYRKSPTHTATIRESYIGRFGHYSCPKRLATVETAAPHQGWSREFL